MRLYVINKQWLSSGFGKLWLSIIFFLLVVSTNGQNTYEKLPYCSENAVPGLLLVSTIDGKFSAINSEGELQWQVDTGPGPLLTSNIHNIELTNSGKWIRIIPSLTGSLYRFDGDSLDPIPISAESLLKSSFKYSDDLVISGGVEIRTYGIGFRSGKIFYTCSSLKCTNNSNSESEVDDILILERNTQTVRAVETQSGYERCDEACFFKQSRVLGAERWNFSVGYHNIKLSQISCSDPQANLFNLNVTAVIPDGILLGSRHQDNAQTTWQYHFPSPIVRVWKWNGHKITEIDLFQVRTDNPNETQISPAVYIGMHKKQLYIHESYNLHYKTEAGTGIAESNSLAKIPWKPISASGLLTEDDSTAMSVLYSSEYVNGRGYYLYSENDIRKKTSGLCKNNKTIRFPMLTQNSDPINLGLLFLQWWKELVVILLTTAFLFRLMMKSLIRHQQNQRIIFVERKVEVPSRSNSSSDRTSESSDTVFSSRFLNDFDMLRCLGKGGFGVVFEVKQKIDECHYAIKRIVLPNEESKRDAVMREVKALAKLEHHNIVRYFNSWVEKPPYGWQQEHDNEWLRDTSEFTTDNTTNNQNASSYIFQVNTSNRYVTNHSSGGDSFIVFEKNSKRNSSQTTSNRSNRTETVTFDELCPLEEVSCERDQRSCSLKEVKITDKPPVYLYIQMQLCQKHSLKEWLIENKDRNFTDILNIFRQILSAVEYVHMQGLIHRDLKPSNIFFSLDGQIKVGDFGLVKDEEESYDIQNISSASKDHTKAVGTRLYMSPEQVNGRNYNYKVDIYSLGLIFFELLVYFSTDMERINTLTKLRENHFPNDFIQQYTDEYNLLTKMLCHLPEKRLTTFGIRARPPLNNCDNDYNEMYDFELPKFNRNTGQTTLKP